MLIKFTKAHAASGRQAGDVWDTDEPIARAYIAAGIAVEHKEAETDLLTAARAEIARGFELLQANLNDQVAGLGRTIGSGLASVGTSRRFSPRIDPTESEDEKLSRTGGFRNLAHFSLEVQRSGGQTPGLVRNEGTALGKYLSACDRINVARAVSSPDGMYETSEPDGGALVPPDFTTQIWERLYSTEKLLPRTQGYTISGNTFTMPANSETSRVDGSRWGGVLGYWEGEAQQLTGSRPKFRNLNLRLKKLTVFSFVTNELLTDSATALEQYLGRVVPQEIEFKIHDALINGTGAGIPLGIAERPVADQDGPRYRPAGEYHHVHQRDEHVQQHVGWQPAEFGLAV